MSMLRGHVIQLLGCVAVVLFAGCGGGGGGSAPPAPDSGSNTALNVAFVTSVSGNGDLGSWADADSNTGLAAGDAICQARATAAGLANPAGFVAWLSFRGGAGEVSGAGAVELAVVAATAIYGLYEQIAHAERRKER